MQGGEVLGIVPETPAIEHRVLAPPWTQGTLTFVASPGEYNLNDPVARIRDSRGRETTLYLWHRWPVRRVRPYRERLLPSEPLHHRAKGDGRHLSSGPGRCGLAIPGGFGTGKTITQHQLVQVVRRADLIVYMGCGERGNEMTGHPDGIPASDGPPHRACPMERTVLIANTSNMPVAAREASIYTGITLAEVLPGHGLPRGPDGRFHLALGRGPAGDFRPPGGDAGGGRLSGLPGDPAGGVL